MMRIKPTFLFLFVLGIFFLFQSVLSRSAGAEELEKCIEVFRNKNYTESAGCFKGLAEQGNTGAQTWLGSLYAEGKGVPRDYEEAAKWLGKAAQQGSAEAQYELASLYQKGQGVKQNYSEAFKWFKKAAAQGHKNSQNSLGYLYREGKGVKQDFEEAAKWYRKAAEQGLPTAQSELGFFYLLGKGVPQDYDEAARWFKKAADQGFTIAQINLAYCYEFGKGVPLDYAEALKWLNKAAGQGNKEAQKKLANLESEKDKLNAPRLTDSEYLSIARMSEEKYKDCDTALDSYLEVSEQGRKDPEWSLSTAKAFECIKNYKEALYYYKKYGSLKPGQKRISEKLMELQSLIMKGTKGEIRSQGATQSTTQTNTGKSGKCLAQCSQALSKCGTTEKCQKIFSICTDKCRDKDIWKNVSSASGLVDVSEIRYMSYPDYTRVVIRLSDKVDFTKTRIPNPDRLFFDLKNCKIKKELQKTIMVGNDMLKSVRANQFSESTVRVVLDLREATDFKVFTEEAPISIIIDIYGHTGVPPHL